VSLDHEQFADLVRAGQVGDAFGLLAAESDLPVRELPKLTSSDLDEGLADPDAERSFLAGLFDPSANVRKTVKKAARALGSGRAELLLAMVLESWEPFRDVSDGSGAAGAWDGLASPLGMHIRRLGPSFELQKRGDAYSPAERQARVALEIAIDALATLDPRTFVVLFEFLEAKTRSPVDRDPAAPHDHGGLARVFMLMHLASKNAFGRVVHKKPALLAELVEVWLDGHTEAAQLGETAREALERTLSDGDRSTLRRRLYWAAAGKLGFLSPEDRERLHARAGAVRKACGDELTARWLTNLLDKFREAYPVEVVEPACSTTAGVPLDVFEEAISDLAGELGLDAVVEQLEEEEPVWSWDDEDEDEEQDLPPGPGAEEDAASLLALVEFARGNATEVGEGSSVISEAAMDGLPDVERIESMIRRGWDRAMLEYADESGDLEEGPEWAGHALTVSGLTRWVITLLPLGRLAALGGWLDEQAGRYPWTYLDDEGAAAVLECRCLVEPAVMIPWLASLERHWAGSRRNDAVWQVAVARMLVAGDEPRQLALDAIGQMPWPDQAQSREENGWKEAWDAAAWAAWEAGDMEVLAAMLERCALPYVRSDQGVGRRASMPPVAEPRPFKRFQRKPRREGGAELKRVWPRIREGCPERVDAVVGGLMRCADHSWLARHVLDLVRRDRALREGGFRYPADELLDLLESPSAPSQRLGLDAVADSPRSAEPALDEVVDALRRACGAAQKGVVTRAVKAAKAVGEAFPEVADECRELVEEAG